MKLHESAKQVLLSEEEMFSSRKEKNKAAVDIADLYDMVVAKLQKESGKKTIEKWSSNGEMASQYRIEDMEKELKHVTTNQTNYR